MASLINRPDNTKWIQFVDTDGRRQTIRLGKMDKRTGASVKVHVERLVAAKRGGHVVGDDTLSWLDRLDDAIHARLASAGLVAGRGQERGVSLGDWLAQFFGALDAKPNTFIIYGQVRRNLEAYFGTNKPLRDIGAADGDAFRRYLVEQGLAENTVARRIKASRMFFRRAVKRKLLADNPFEDVRAGCLTNPAKSYFVTRREADAVLEHCPDAQWRLLFALSRYGGLRCPSEHLALKWSDILWDQKRIRVPSPKTEHLPGGECRVIPMFPELAAPLLEVYEQADAGAEYVITRYRQSNCNLRTQLQRIIRRAGLKDWPRLWHNLRASRETELAEQYPIQTVCQWIGNSVEVARKHYLQVTDEHFRRAAENPVEQAKHFPKQYTSELGGSKVKTDFVDKSVSDAFTTAYHDMPYPTKTLSGGGGNRTPVPR